MIHNNISEIELNNLKNKFAIKYFPRKFFEKIFQTKIFWNNRFKGATAGIARYSLVNNLEYNVIEISSKYIKQYPDMLKCILLHEMIHICIGVKEKHGLKFKTEMNRINDILNIEGEKNQISVKIPIGMQLDKEYKYIYLCKECSQEYKRVRNLIDIKRHVCGKCRGKLLQIK